MWDDIRDFFKSDNSDEWLIANCSFNFGEKINVLNFANILTNGLNGKVSCNFQEEKGNELGELRLDIKVTKDGIKTKMEMNDDLLGSIVQRVI
jgi:hypothetical protein